MLLHDLEDEEDEKSMRDVSDASQPNSSGEDSIHQIRYTIDEMFHQATHLIRSQMELLDAIQENPDDADFAEAFWENKEILQTKKRRIQDLLAKIWSRDPVYFRKVDKMLSELFPDSEEELKADSSNIEAAESAREILDEQQVSDNNRNRDEPLPHHSDSAVVGETTSTSGLYL